jgi:hypothetical protein
MVLEQFWTLEFVYSPVSPDFHIFLNTVYKFQGLNMEKASNFIAAYIHSYHAQISSCLTPAIRTVLKM